MTEAGHAASMADAASQTARRLIDTLPAQFLVLVLMNTAFLMGLLWFLERQSAGRERVITAIVTQCLERK